MSCTDLMYTSTLTAAGITMHMQVHYGVATERIVTAAVARMIFTVNCNQQARVVCS